MNIKAVVSFLLAFYAAQVVALDFSASKWIWTNELTPAGLAPPGSRAFRRDFYSPQGKTALSANIIITADNGYTLYVNGAAMGSGHYFPAAEAHCVRLAPDCNVFAVNATNDLTVPNPAGVLVAIQIKYTDGFTQNIVSDGTWHAFTSVPAGFQQVGFDDSAWPPATIEANYGASPWGQIITPPSASSAPLSLTDANWIWTNEVSNSGTAPAGSRAFRKVITLPDGQKATSATVVMGADDAFTLYVNGRLVGSNSDYTRARRFVVDIQPSVSTIDIAVFANNVGGPAGLIGSFELEMEDCDCGSRITFVTDGTWKYNSAVPSPVGFQEPGFDDSQWPVANVEGKYGIAPWGSIAIPDAVSPASAKIVGAPDANAANVVTLRSSSSNRLYLVISYNFRSIGVLLLPTTNLKFRITEKAWCEPKMNKETVTDKSPFCRVARRGQTFRRILHDQSREPYIGLADPYHVLKLSEMGRRRFARHLTAEDNRGSKSIGAGSPKITSAHLES